MSNLLIHTLLDTRLKTVSGLPTLQEENNRIRIGAGTKAWCRSTLIPNPTFIATIGQQGYSSQTGIFQIDLFYPGDASYQSTFIMAQTIIAMFPAGLQIDDVRIVNSYSRAGFSGAPNYYTVPVVIEYEYYYQRTALI